MSHPTTSPFCIIRLYDPYLFSTKNANKSLRYFVGIFLKRCSVAWLSFKVSPPALLYHDAWKMTFAKTSRQVLALILIIKEVALTVNYSTII